MKMHIKDFIGGGGYLGESGSPLCNGEKFIAWLNQNFLNKDILEVGPGARPRMLGRNVKYYDCRSTEALREWAAKNRLDKANVPEIDYVGDGGNFNCIERKFDLIFSSHNIEHVPDLIGYLNNLGLLLKQDGMMALIVPDKRFTFDYYRRLTEVSDVLDGSLRYPDTKPGFHEFFEARRLQTHNNDIRHWAGDHGTVNNNINIEEIFSEYINAKSFPDFHRWTFTCDSFYNLIDNLYKSGFVSIKPERVWNTPKNTNAFNALLINTQGRNNQQSSLAKDIAEGLTYLGCEKIASACFDNLAENVELCNEIMLHKRYAVEHYLVWLWQKLSGAGINEHEDCEDIKAALEKLYSDKLFADSAEGLSRLIYAIWLVRYDLHKFDPTSNPGQKSLIRWFKNYGIREFNLERLNLASS